MTSEGDHGASTDPGPSAPYEPAVFINWIDLDTDTWDGLWQDGPEHRSFTGTLREVQEWAASQVAVRYWIYDGSKFVSWDPSSWTSAN